MKIEITSITLLLRAFPDFFGFQHVPHVGDGISQIEWKLKLKTKIGQNDHSNPYIESTTVLSDNKTYIT